MKKTILTLATVSAIGLSYPALAGSGLDHGHGHNHAAPQASGHDHGDAHGHGGEHMEHGATFASSEAALGALKAALEEVGTANNADAVHTIFPKIESSAMYLHDNGQPASPENAERFHAAVDQLGGLVQEMHDKSHGADQATINRLLKKMNGAVALVEAYISTSSKGE